MSTQYIGREILIVSENNPLIQDLQKILQKEGFLVSVAVDQFTLEDLLENKFFIIALIDLDVNSPDHGLEILELSHRLSPATHNFLVTARESFTSCVKAFRTGCRDVIHIKPDEIAYLIDNIRKSATEIAHASERDRLLKEMYSVHNNFFKKMLALHIKLTELEDAARMREGVDDAELPPMQILIVDSDDTLENSIASIVNENDGWYVKRVSWGAEALDYGTSGQWQSILVGRHLQDLPASMVASSLSAMGSEAEVLIFSISPEGIIHIASPDGEDQSNVSTIDLISRFRNRRIDMATKSAKKQHIKTFKAQHYDFLQKYSKIKSRVEKLFGENIKDEFSGDQ